MRILIKAHHYAVASGRYMADALKRLGHDVRTDGPAHGNVVWGMTVDERHAWIPNKPEKGWEPELVIIADAHLDADAARGYECPVVVYGVDNHVRDYAQYDVDHMFLAHGHGHRIGEEHVTWLPCGYDPRWFTPGKDWNAREFDAAMVGVQYGPRNELLYALLSHFVGIRIAYGVGALYEDFAAAYQNARVSLVRSAAGDVAQRVWETAVMGCLVLKDANADDEALGLVDGKNCLTYTTPDEAVEKMRWALFEPDAAQKIARAGQRWAKPGTWDERMKVIVEWAQGQASGLPYDGTFSSGQSDPSEQLEEIVYGISPDENSGQEAEKESEKDATRD